MGRPSGKPKLSVNRHLFRSMAEKARITEKAADVMFDEFMKFVQDAYLNDDALEIFKYGIITPVPVKEILAWNINKRRVDYILLNRNPKIRMFPTIKSKKKCQHKQKSQK